MRRSSSARTKPVRQEDREEPRRSSGRVKNENVTNGRSAMSSHLLVVGTGGGCGDERGPGACPGGQTRRQGPVRPEDRIPTRTGTTQSGREEKGPPSPLRNCAFLVGRPGCVSTLEGIRTISLPLARICEEFSHGAQDYGGPRSRSTSTLARVMVDANFPVATSCS